MHPSAHRPLLLLDGVINLLLGLLLVVFPEAVVRALGVPNAESRFYPSILGAVLVGIGVALLLERSRRPGGAVGLGLGGAVAINLCAAAALAGWLLLGDLDLTLAARGCWVLWTVVAVLVVVSVAEIRRQRGPGPSDWVEPPGD